MTALRASVRVRRFTRWRWLGLLFSSNPRRVLLVTREYTQDGAGRYLDFICEMLQRHDYEICVVQYTPHRGQISRFWDKEFYVKALCGAKLSGRQVTVSCGRVKGGWPPSSSATMVTVVLSLPGQ